MSALRADLLTRGDLNNNDLCRDLAGLWHPVDNAVFFWRPREIPGEGKRGREGKLHYEMMASELEWSNQRQETNFCQEK